MCKKRTFSFKMNNDLNLLVEIEKSGDKPSSALVTCQKEFTI